MERDNRKEELDKAIADMNARRDDFEQKRDKPKKRYSLNRGLRASEKILATIGPYIKQSILVGSIGRRENFICDIDILVEPMDQPAIKAIRTLLHDMGEWKRGGERQMVVENIFDSGLTLDLFLCHPPAQWGVITAVRLNPIPLVIYGKKVIDELGFIRRNGTILQGKNILDMSTEAAWFELVGIKYVSPDKRWELTRDLRLI